MQHDELTHDEAGPILAPPVSKPDPLTKVEAAAAADAWRRLDEIKDRLEGVPLLGLEPYDVRALGRMTALAQVAAEAAFRFLNHSASYGHSAAAHAAIRRHLDR